MEAATECQLKPGETLDGKDYLEYMRTVIKGKSDPLWWIKTYLGVEFEPDHLMQETILREWYRHCYNSTLTPYRTMYIMAGMRGGKTALDSMITCYELFDVLTLPKQPWEYYRLMRNQLVTLAMLSISRDQSDDGLWGNVQNFLTDCQWFQQWSDLVLRADYADVPSKHVGLRVFSSSSQTNIGRSNRFVALDELDSFETTEGKRDSWKVYSKMLNSTQTFRRDGRLCAISSSGDDPTSIMNKLVNDTKKRNETTPYDKRTSFAVVAPTWVMNTAISEAELKEEYKDNMAAFYRDFACQPGMYVGMEFPDGVVLKTMDNVFKTWTSPVAGLPHVLAIDPSATNDAFGISIGYKSRGKVTVYGAHRFTKTGNDIFINSDDIERFVDQAVLSFNVKMFITDTWMYPNIARKMMAKGIIVQKHIVYKEDYDRLKGMIKDGTADVIAHPILEKELLTLKVISDKKVDHPHHGSKDVADSVANVVWGLTDGQCEPMKPKVLAMQMF